VPGSENGIINLYFYEGAIMIKSLVRAAAVTFVLATFVASNASAEDQNVGKVVQLRGTATIERGKSQIPAQVKGGILASDIITTASSSRAKLLFIDDSVLTMSDNSKVVVKEFIYAKGKEGKSVFNLLDGKMRSVVGKTKFEVHTPTAVAAARGTVIYFDVGKLNNQAYSKIICLEGNVQIRNVVSTIAGQVTLTPGTMVIVKANEPPPPPVPAPQSELDNARRATQGNGNGSDDSSNGGGTPGGSSGDSGSGSGSQGGSSGNGGQSLPMITSPTTPSLPSMPPITQQPIVQPRRVNINIGVPGQ
jgi:uncharacterized membrane protein YgcG